MYMRSLFSVITTRPSGRKSRPHGLLNGATSVMLKGAAGSVWLPEMRALYDTVGAVPGCCGSVGLPPPL